MGAAARCLRCLPALALRSYSRGESKLRLEPTIAAGGDYPVRLEQRLPGSRRARINPAPGAADPRGICSTVVGHAVTAGEIAMASFGPWAEGLDPAERIARLRALRALAGIFAWPDRSFRDLLWDAEEGDPTVLEAAYIELDRLPALRRRKLLSAYLRASSSR